MNPDPIGDYIAALAAEAAALRVAHGGPRWWATPRARALWAAAQPRRRRRRASRCGGRR